MATVCSCLKYYGHVIIGVAREEDRILVNDMVSVQLVVLLMGSSSTPSSPTHQAYVAHTTVFIRLNL